MAELHDETSSCSMSSSYRDPGCNRRRREPFVNEMTVSVPSSEPLAGDRGMSLAIPWRLKWRVSISGATVMSKIMKSQISCAHSDGVSG